jgi:hypothetical protein
MAIIKNFIFLILFYFLFIVDNPRNSFKAQIIVKTFLTIFLLVLNMFYLDLNSYNKNTLLNLGIIYIIVLFIDASIANIVVLKEI